MTYTRMKKLPIAAVSATVLLLGAPAIASAVGPHSKLGNIELPAGSTPVSGVSWSSDTVNAESWHYPGTFDDTVAFF